ncbi:SAM-dependent methyltransferase [Aquimarina brevivitae]|uniref:Ubiquinone/menaquinone biosynthesis C-methylase UbiE n=1 Tax=Aquimarina brevivitae TaxID=323412 RepID=A0A4Q7PH89_9FLAO|nr:class I SAM-dependent methyltransferase [Aquimarina brevivitae]RZS99916.1 ubiquinone/menaquinone biosynthesis C-methylase UbiE [Aquimarina brevivitae]
MDTSTLIQKLKQAATKEKIIDFYDEATEDYLHWSKDHNMHFGYYIPFKNTFLKRDSMLNEMNHQVLKRLSFPKKESLVLDLGCGIGGTMHQLLLQYPYINALGTTISNKQVELGNQKIANKNGLIINADFRNLPIANNTADGAFAIESFCHAGHSDEAFIEVYRVLKPGASVVIADAFLRKEPQELCSISNYCYEQLCMGWSLQGLRSIQEVKQSLYNIGFRKVTLENISWQVAPSVLHVPFAIIGFLLKKIVKRETIRSQSWNNLKGSLFALLSGLHFTDFGYYIITATK